MRWAIEESGCCVKGDMKQVRLCFYLEPADDRYSKHRVNAPIAPKTGYPGKKGQHGKPESETDFLSWVDALPHKWRVNPFHNHFLQVPVRTSNKAIAAMADELLPQFYRQWKSGELEEVKHATN